MSTGSGLGVTPMLAQATRDPPRNPDWVYEPKWDGIRGLAGVGIAGNQFRLESRHGRDITTKFPELSGLAEAVPPETILDGELVVVTETGHGDDTGYARVDFGAVMSRFATNRITTTSPAATYIVFDLLSLDGRDLRGHPWHRRRALLETLHLSTTTWVTTLVGTHLDKMMSASRDYGLEGIVAKRRTSPYQAGRSRGWLKHKHRHITNLLVCGWRLDRHDRITLLLGEPGPEGHLWLRARITTDADHVIDLRDTLHRLHTPHPTLPAADNDATTRWVRPVLTATVAYTHHDPTGILRQAHLLRIRTDRPG